MQDRVPTPGQEGRVLITPENGGAPFYATVTMADNPSEAGTPFNKATLWKDATAALFGLGVDSVPDDGFAYLGKYSQYWWKRRKGYDEWEYVQSSSRNAYPDSGEQDGYEYQYLGVPFDNAATAPKIQAGSYIGTGTYGADNPNSLTLEFQPQIVIIHGQTQSANNPFYNYGYTIMVRPATRYETIVTNAVDYSGTIVWGNNEVLWFVEANSGRQFNLSGEQYEYVAIG